MNYQHALEQMREQLLSEVVGDPDVFLAREQEDAAAAVEAFAKRQALAVIVEFEEQWATLANAGPGAVNLDLQFVARVLHENVYLMARRLLDAAQDATAPVIQEDEV